MADDAILQELNTELAQVQARQMALRRGGSTSVRSGQSSVMLIGLGELREEEKYLRRRILYRRLMLRGKQDEASN